MFMVVLFGVVAVVVAIAAVFRPASHS